VEISGRHQAQAGVQWVAIDRFANREGTQGIEVRGQGSGKGRRNVLHDHDRRKAVGQTRQEIPKRFHAARRCAEHDDAPRRKLPGFKRGRERLGRLDGRRSISGSSTRAAGRLDVKGQFAGNLTQTPATVGLGYDIQRSGHQRFHCLGRTGRSQ
jgi:hypothetical protein